MSAVKFDPKASLEQLVAQISRIRRYSFFIFLVFVGGLYAFLVLKIGSLTTAQPTDQAVTSQVQAAAVPRIDPKLIQQLQSLQDNSVSVKALFTDNGRQNPFHE